MINFESLVYIKRCETNDFVYNFGLQWSNIAFNPNNESNKILLMVSEILSPSRKRDLYRYFTVTSKKISMGFSEVFLDEKTL
jgi:hypothetical protein